MKLLIGIAIGIALCSVFPDQMQDLGNWTRNTIHEVAHSVASTTEPTVTERVIEPLTDWRNK